MLTIYDNNLLLFIQNSDICNYADDTTIYSCDKSLDTITHKLKNDCNVALKTLGSAFNFMKLFMKLNADKCHFMVLGQRSNDLGAVKIGNTNVVNSLEENLLGVHINSKLSFGYHVSKLCQKLAVNLPAYPRIWINANAETRWGHLFPVSFNTVLYSGCFTVGSLTKKSTFSERYTQMPLHVMGYV